MYAQTAVKRNIIPRNGAYRICRILPSKAQNILSFESGSPVNATIPLEFINVTVYNTTHEYTTYK